MALSTRRRNIIIADWKTGAYSLNSLAKKHKIAVNTVKKICTGIKHENAHYVEVLTASENAKSCIKTAQEVRSVEEVVRNRLKVQTISTKLLDKIEKHIDKNKKLEKINVGNGMQDFKEVELESSDYKNLADAIDKTSLTLGVNERFSGGVKVETNIQNNQLSNQILTLEEAKKQALNLGVPLSTLISN